LWEKKVFESDYFLISSQTKEKNSLNSGSPQHSQQKIHAEKYKKRVVEEGGDEDDDDGGHVKKIDLGIHLKLLYIIFPASFFMFSSQ
jgi:hypothetical protein